MESLARSRVQGFPQHLSSIRGAESFDKKLAAYESANHLRHLEWFGKVRLKPMQISTSTRYALSACVAVAILAGCNSTANVTPAQGTGLAPNGTGVVQSVAPGFTDLRRCRSGCRRKIEGSLRRVEAPEADQPALSRSAQAVTRLDHTAEHSPAAGAFGSRIGPATSVTALGETL